MGAERSRFIWLKRNIHQARVQKWRQLGSLSESPVVVHRPSGDLCNLSISEMWGSYVLNRGDRYCKILRIGASVGGFSFDRKFPLLWKVGHGSKLDLGSRFLRSIVGMDGQSFPGKVDTKGCSTGQLVSVLIMFGE